MTFPCAIAPLDQSATQLGWHIGTFTRSPCPVFGSCMTRQEGLQFLADAMTPVVAPFDAILSGSTLTPTFAVPVAIASSPVRVRVSGVTVIAPAGPIQKGALLGRVARGTRPAAVFTLDGGNVTALFSDLGLDIVGAQRPRISGYSLTPFQGGRLLARSGGPADCISMAQGLRGLGADVAPAGYLEPDASVYGRFGVSRLTNTNVSPPGSTYSSGSGWGLVAWLGVGAVALWAAKR